MAVLKDLIVQAMPDSPQPKPLISEHLARFAYGLRYEDIPAEVTARAKYLVLDALGIALASTRFDFARDALAGLSMFEPGERAAFGMDRRLALRDAVTLNGVLVHGLDYDDTHIEGVVHVSSSCFPCAFGVATQTGANGRDFLTAYVTAVETASRIGMAAGGGLHLSGLHPTGSVAAFAAALAAGRLYGLTTEQMVMAQGIALSTMAISSRQYSREGAGSKRLHPGWGATAGITAAALARGGMTGPRATYEGDYGFFQVNMAPHMARCNLALATAGLGEVWETGRVAIKPIPACHLVHACSDAIVALVREHGLRATDIASIQALVPREAYAVVCEPLALRKRPVSSYSAQFSLHYAVAASIVCGRFSLAEMTPEFYTNPEILALVDKVEHGEYPGSEYPKYFSGEVRVKTRDGREFVKREHINRGAADRPLSSDDITEKFMDNATTAVSKAQAIKLREAVLTLESAGDLKAVEALFACGKEFS
jgi:2-methylcitrate dehydratase PrpD